jgi:phosphonatase-like hydrolase
MTRPELVVFDMIGTTVQASYKIPQAFTNAFVEEGIRLSTTDVSSVRGKSKREAIRELLRVHGGEDVAARRSDEVYAAFKQFLLEYYRNEPVISIRGAESIFCWCRERDIKIALTTGFDRELAAILVQKLGWLDSIDALVCNDDVSAGRPAPDLILAAMCRLDCANVERVASVGDTVSDLEAGAHAGTGWNVGVLSGAHSRDQLLAAPHTILIDSIVELPDVFLS